MVAAGPRARRGDIVSSCRAELCSMWGGDECLCALFGFDPDDPPRDGTFTVVLPTEQA